MREKAITWDKVKNLPVKSFIYKDGLLYRVCSQNNDLQLSMPQSSQKEVLQLAHEGLLGGHMGSGNTFSRISSQFYWTGYSQEVNTNVIINNINLCFILSTILNSVYTTQLF